MESSTHVISITNNGEDNVVAPTMKEGGKTLQCLLRKNKIHSSLYPIASNYKQLKSDHDTRRIIHSIKVGISLVLVSLFYILNPLFEQVGENAMWAIMTVIVIFEFSAGTLINFSNMISLILILYCI